MRTEFDVLIAGAGLVGLSLAAQLGRHGFRVQLLEAGQPPEEAPAEPGLRVSAISRASQKLLTDIGAWQQIPASFCHPYTSMRVWDSTVAAFGDRALAFDASSMDEPDLGHIVSNNWMLWALTQVVSACDNISVTYRTAVEDIEFKDGAVRVFSDDHQQFVAQLLAGADGARSVVSKLGQFNVAQKKYHQRGVVCNVSPQLSHQNTAWQRFLPGGPLAFLPLANGECSIVWSVSDDNATQLAAFDDGQFEQALTDASDGVLGALKVTSKRASFPLILQHADRYARPGLVLTGDAAHVVHPLAGQGVNMGFADSDTLAAVLLEGRERGDACGDLRALRRYERNRKYHNRKMLVAMDGIQQLFSVSYPWLTEMRSLGMGVVNSVAPLKSFFAQQALG